MGCNTGRRNGSFYGRRRRRGQDDLLDALGLTGLGDQISDEVNSALDSGSSKRVEELEEQVQEMAKTMTSMAERIKVLERIVVDSEAELSREIDRLRDT